MVKTGRKLTIVVIIAVLIARTLAYRLINKVDKRLSPLYMPVLGHLPVTDDTFHEDDPYIHHHAMAIAIPDKATILAATPRITHDDERGEHRYR